LPGIPDKDAGTFIARILHINLQQLCHTREESKGPEQDGIKSSIQSQPTFIGRICVFLDIWPEKSIT
jgi:hypothetical protein